MLMNNKRFSVFLLVIMLVFMGSMMVCAQQGPSTIDVSKYPKKIQDIYTQEFSQKCMLCHSLSRPINSNFVLPSEWGNYVNKMEHMPGSNINSGDASKILDFLIYDSSVRKKALLDDKLSKLTPEEKTADQAEIKKIYDTYDH